MKIKVNKHSFPYKEYSNFGKHIVDLSDTQKKYILQFNKNVTDGIIEFEEVQCLCCNKEFDLIAKTDRYGILQDTVICTQCGLIQSNPRMTPNSTMEFYNSDVYRNCYDDNYLNQYKKMLLVLPLIPILAI